MIMDKTGGITEFERFPLRYAYQFLSDKGYGDKVNEIRNSKDIYKSYTSTLRRAKIIHLFDETELLDEFINQFWPAGLTKKGENRLSHLRRLYDSFINYSGDEEEEEEEESIEGTSFAYEEDLKNYLASNLTMIESGLKLYVDENGQEGIEYSVDSKNKRIDILAIDNNEIPVIIELKVSKGYEKVIGQTLYYKSCIKRIFNADKVRMIIVAREITEQLKLATEEIKDVELFEYNLSIKLDRIS